MAMAELERWLAFEILGRYHYRDNRIEDWDIPTRDLSPPISLSEQ
jgi:hypothetical protein